MDTIKKTLTLAFTPEQIKVLTQYQEANPDVRLGPWIVARLMEMINTSMVIKTIKSTNSIPAVLKAKFESNCNKCGKNIEIGSKIFWCNSNKKAYHAPTCRLDDAWINEGSPYFSQKKWAIEHKKTNLDERTNNETST